MQSRRAEWKAQQLGLPVHRLVFIDETGLRTNLVRRYGRARRGQRLVDRTPHGHWKTTTFVSALRHDRLTAPMVVDGLCVVQLGSDSSGAVVAYDLGSGEQKWKWDGDGTAYASPVQLTVDGVRAVVAECAKSVVAGCERNAPGPASRRSSASSKGLTGGEATRA